MAKIVTITSFGTEVRTAKTGKSYEVFALKGTSTFQGKTQEYSRDIMKGSLKQNPELAADIKSIGVGSVVEISYDSTPFKNIARIISTEGSSAPVVSHKASAPVVSSFKAKEFKLTDESVRIGALQIAVAEAPGKPINLKRVTEILALIRTGVGIEPTSVAVEEISEEEEGSDKPF